VARRARSPRGVPQPAIPTLLLHGDADTLVSVDQARRLAAHRDALGVPTRLVIYPGAPHGFYCDERASYRKESGDLAWSRTQEFFSKHMK
jgi:carboxymethylenebutenolidase